MTTELALALLALAVAIFAALIAPGDDHDE